MSYVLNGRTDQRVSPETRERILRIARDVGFVPNAAAIALKTGRTNIVLLDMPFWPLGAPTVEGVTWMVGELEDLGYTPLVHFERKSNGQKLAEACQRLQPVGLIATGSFLTKARCASLRASGVVGMVAFHHRPLSHVPTIAFHQDSVGELAIDYLAGRGHRRVLALMPLHGDEARYRSARLRGAERSAERTKVELHVERTDLDPASMTQAIQRSLSTKQAPTAIYAFNDEYARAAQGSLADLGLRVPSDIALLGCDDGPLARYGSPRLTSIAVSSPKRWTHVAKTVHRAIVGEPVDDITPMGRLHVVERETA